MQRRKLGRQHIPALHRREATRPNNTDDKKMHDRTVVTKTIKLVAGLHRQAEHQQPQRQIMATHHDTKSHPNP